MNRNQDKIARQIVAVSDKFSPIVRIEWIKHIHCEGARWHVLSWSSLGVKCSEPNCIVNKPND